MTLSERMLQEEGPDVNWRTVLKWADEVAALEANYATAIEANIAVAKRNSDLIAENAGLELMIMEGAEQEE